MGEPARQREPDLRAAFVLCVSTLLAACSSERVQGSSSERAQAPRASATVSASASGAVNGPLDAASLMRDVGWLASSELHGRGSATVDEARAASRLAAELDRLGLDTVGPEKLRTQRFDASTLALLPADRAQPSPSSSAVAPPARASSNVMGLVHATSPRYPDELVVIGAHFDHLGSRDGVMFPGADDNASGTAAVLGVARSLVHRKGELGRDILFVFFGSEETGLRGSRAFLGSGVVPVSRMAAMVNVDMVGRALNDEPLARFAEKALGIDASRSIGIDGTRGRPTFEELIRGTCKAEGHEAVTIDDLPETLRPLIEELSHDRADNASFERAGVPALFFCSGESSDYHQPSDTVESLDPALLATRARIIERTVIGVSTLPRVRPGRAQ